MAAPAKLKRLTGTWDDATETMLYTAEYATDAAPTVTKQAEYGVIGAIDEAQEAVDAIETDEGVTFA